MLISKVTKQYEVHSKTRICQGDILRDFTFNDVDSETRVREIKLPYIIILSQDCDLERAMSQLSAESSRLNQYLPNIMFVPAFTDEELKNGEHLNGLYKVTQEKIPTDRMKLIKQNNNERYHFLSSDGELQIPDLIIDFKLYFTLDYKNVHSKYAATYLATASELFRERLSQRFVNYLGRIGLPEFPTK